MFQRSFAPILWSSFTRLTHFALTAVFLCTASVATAQSISASNPNSVVAALSAQGHAPELTADNGGDPMINAEAGGIYYSVLFYGCTANTNCQDLQLRGTFSEPVLTPEDIAAHNRDWFVGKVFLSNSGFAVIEHPMVGVDGMSRATLNRTLDRWTTALKRLKEAAY